MSNTRTVEVENSGIPWWLVLIQGVAVIILGILLFTRPVATTIILIQFLGIYWLITGILSIISLLWDRTAWGWKLFSGILGVLAGLFYHREPAVEHVTGANHTGMGTRVYWNFNWYHPAYPGVSQGWWESRNFGRDDGAALKCLKWVGERLIPSPRIKFIYQKGDYYVNRSITTCSDRFR